MASFLIDETFLPAIVTSGPMTDEEFANVCATHPDLSFEMSAEGELIIMPRTFTLTGARNSEITLQLGMWARQDKRGMVFDSSTGWVLPNGARRSPDAAWLLKERVKQLDPAMLNRFWRACPDFVIELRSRTDRMPTLREKMAEWIANGSQLAWMLDPEDRSVEIYRPGRNPESRPDCSSVHGEGPVQGFVLDLLPVWDPITL